MTQDVSRQVLDTIAHRPYPLPAGRWVMTQRWNDLLFAHWRIDPAMIAPFLPPGLEVDTYDGSAWLGVIPFWMDQVRSRPAGPFEISVPGTTSFSELNLRTYVRSRRTGLSGIFFFSLDAGSALAVLGARVLFHLPYFVARMSRGSEADGTIRYASDRLITPRTASLRATYRPSGDVMPPSQPGSLAYFLTERYCLFTTSVDTLLVGHVHHVAWPLQPATADFETNTIAPYFGFDLPDEKPVLYFSRELHVFIWPLATE